MLRRGSCGLTLFSVSPAHSTFPSRSIFLYGLECPPGKQIELSGEVRSLQAEGFNSHVLSVRIKGAVEVSKGGGGLLVREGRLGVSGIFSLLSFYSVQARRERGGRAA